MKKYILALTLIGSVLAGNAANKFDAASRAALDVHRNLQPGVAAVPALGINAIPLLPGSRGEELITLLITLNDGYSASDIEDLVSSVTGVYGSVVVANVVLDSLDDLQASDAVASMSISKECRPLLDKARSSVAADAIHKGSDAALSQAFDGTGVIAGIFDSGMDINHPNFLDKDGKPRTTRIFRYAGNNGVATTYSDPAQIAAFTTDDRDSFHGTHVYGCMVGSYNGAGTMVQTKISGAKVVETDALHYYGMAPGAELAVGCGPLADANILDGVQRIVQYAKEQGRPAVVNLSIGFPIGPHDGTDALTKGLGSMTDDAILCIASGNEADLNNTIIYTGSDTPLRTMLHSSESSFSGSIDFWCEDGSEFTLTPFVVDSTTGEVYFEYPISSTNEKVTYITSNNYTMPIYVHNTYFNRYFSSSFLQFTASTNQDTNKRTNILLSYQITYNSTNNADKNVLIGLMVTAPEGKRVDMVSFSDNDVHLTSNGLKDYTDGSNLFSASSMACVPNTISVGAWNTRRTWNCLDGYTYGYDNPDGLYDLNKIADFSSFGTLVDGRTIPTVCAPGTGIISSTSYYYTKQVVASTGEAFCARVTNNDRDYYWVAQMGTSMACPIVAGSVALWLQADPTLTSEKAIEIIRETATQDKYTVEGNPVQWGAGKFNALAGLKKVLESTGVGSILADDAHGLILTGAGQNVWEAYVPTASATTVKVYNLSGRLVKQCEADGHTATVDCSALTPGVYVLQVNGTYTRRVAVL